jgi:predicted PurR-regulated permease PerM
VLLAKDYDDIMNRLLEREECYVFLEIVCGIIRYIATFVKAQLIIMSIIGAVAAAALGISGIRNGILWGLLAGFLDALPFIGTGVVLVPLSIQQFFIGSYVRGAVCLLVYVACIFIRELLEPRLIGKRIGVSPIAILLSIYAGIKLFGMWGIIGGLHHHLSGVPEPGQMGKRRSGKTAIFLTSRTASDKMFLCSRIGQDDGIHGAG